LVFLVLLCVCPGSGEVRRDQLFPFGSLNGDTTLNKHEIGTHSDLITLKTPYPFFNTTYPALYVNNYGNILFNSIPGDILVPFKCHPNRTNYRDTHIAPFWSAVHTENGGHVYYRETLNPSLISRAEDEVKQGFPGGDLSFKSVFIVTWDRVAHYRLSSSCPDDGLRNTFQAILATDGIKSFVIFYYNELTWTTFTQEVYSKCVENDEFRAAAGFTAGLGNPFQDVLGTCESNVLKLTDKSNVGHSGKWVFRVDGEIQSPTFREYVNAEKQDTIHGIGVTIPESDLLISEQKYLSPTINNETDRPDHGVTISDSDLPTSDKKYTAFTASNRTNIPDFVHSVSSDGTQSSIRFYFYAIFLIICMYI